MSSAGPCPVERVWAVWSLRAWVDMRWPATSPTPAEVSTRFRPTWARRTRSRPAPICTPNCHGFGRRSSGFPLLASSWRGSVTTAAIPLPEPAPEAVLMKAVTEEFLQLIGWNPSVRIVTFPRSHSLLGARICPVNRQAPHRTIPPVGEASVDRARRAGLVRILARGAYRYRRSPAAHQPTRTRGLADTRGELEERTKELAAARAANRELTRVLNSPAPE